MTVFKGFMKLVRRNMNVLLMYFAIFLTICVLLQMATKGKGLTHFEEERLNIAVIDRDGGVLAKGLRTYLGDRHNLVDVPDDKDVIQEELFYRNLYYVVTIPEDFENICLMEGEKLKTTKLPGTSSAFYVDQQINIFLNDVKILAEGGFPLEEAVNIVKKAGETDTDVELIDKNGFGGTAAPHAYMFQFMPYIMLSVLCYILGYIMIMYREKEVRRRMLCSAVSSRNQNVQLILGYLAVGVGVFIICMLLPVALYGKTFLTDPNLPYYAFNVFMMMLVSLSISFLIGTIIKKEQVINAVVNVITLGMSFTCGVFVSLDVLGKGLKVAAHFLPVYWYETVNGILLGNADFTRSQQIQIWQGYGIQFLFAAAILCAGMVVSKYTEQE